MMLQLEGVLKLGGTDYSDEIKRFTIRQRRQVVAKPATFGNATPEQKASTRTYELEIELYNDKDTTSTTMVWNALWDAALTASGELTFSGQMATGAIATTNPEWSGTIVVTGAEIGGEVGIYNTQRWVFPITAAGVSEDVTP